MNRNQYRKLQKNLSRNFDLTPAGAGVARIGSFPGKIWTVWLLVTLLIGVAATGAFGQETARVQDVLRTTLKNGLQVVIVPNRLAPVATIVVNYRVGSKQAPAEFPGTAHALEHMMFRGSPGLSGEQLANVTAAIGGYFNADTQQTVTQYFFTVPVADLDVALHIESLRMRAILADEKSWGRERGAIEQEVAQDTRIHHWARAHHLTGPAPRCSKNSTIRGMPPITLFWLSSAMCSRRIRSLGSKDCSKIYPPKRFPRRPMSTCNP